MDTEGLENRFTYHPVKSSNQAQKYERIREYAKDLASTLDGMCPASRELSLALTHLEEVVFWANASIARHE